MARKVFLSVLGTGHYNPTKYYFDNDKATAIETNFIQEATLRHYPKEKFDKIYIFLTKDARKFNWENPAWKKTIQNPKFDPKPEYIGLSKKLADFNNLETINIADGNNESEIWSIFETIFKALNEGDQLYFDITHGFRTLPMLLMVLINYSKFLKQIEVEKITYGNWEARDVNNYAPVIDVTSFSEIQDWTNAANDLLEHNSNENLKHIISTKNKQYFIKKEGNKVSELHHLMTKIFKISEAINLVDGYTLFKNTGIANFDENYINANKEIYKPLQYILEKLKKRFDKFEKTENTIKNGFEAVDWCIENGLYQNGYSILLENIITFIARKIDTTKIKDRELRTLISSTITTFELDENQLNFSSDDMPLVNKIRSLYFIEEIYEYYKYLSKIRNYLMHAHYNDDSIKNETIREKLSYFNKYFKEQCS
jgi:hypothetical protein